jgi:beta-galactosidase
MARAARLSQTVLLVTAALGLVAGPRAADVPPRPWEDPAVSMRNVEPPRATFVPYASVEQALAVERGQSPFTLSLNGTWRFHWSPTPEAAPARFHEPGFDDRRWSTIPVPSNWEMEGFGYPVFRNVHQPFPATPPFPPSDDNPVGSYRRTFTMPEDWRGRRVFLHFEAVKSAFALWVNGREVGYNEGGFEPAEFDVTGFARPGENLLAVQVLRYSDGTYLECQDMWRLAGIFRDVYLLSAPAVHVRDFAVITDLDAAYRDARLIVTAEVRNGGEAAAQGVSLRARLFDAQRRPVFDEPAAASAGPLPSGESRALRLERTVANPRKWTAETPDLYVLTLELVDAQGAVTEVVSTRVGFREVEVRNQAILVNGVPVKFNGVNSHMLHPRGGSRMDVETLRRDLVLMKQFNVNLVRTSHYPPNVEYLDLADELGVYVVDEVGDESHATEYVSEDPTWRDAYLHRVRKLVHRDRNHPSVVIWSAGNESGSGENIAAVIAEGKRIDPSRPAWCYGGNTDLLPFEDIVGPRYPTVERLAQVAAVPASQDARPSFMDEYLAATGNGMGELDEFWDLIWKHPRLTGGAIWDWMSPGMLARWRTTPDLSPNRVEASLMAGATPVHGRFGNAVSLSGFDQWVEVHRHPSTDLVTDRLTVAAWVYPRPWNGSGSLVTKGSGQFGLVQKDAATLEFYVHTSERVSAVAPVPAGWVGRWHQVAGIYDGERVRLVVDGAVLDTKSCRGALARTAVPVNIGRTADIHGQEHPGRISNAVFDRVRIFPRALALADLDRTASDLAGEAALWLEFDEVHEGPEYYSLGIGARDYGLVWPDRRPQAELWQLKKSPQPVLVEAVDAAKGRFRVTNRHGFTDLAEFTTVWQLSDDEKLVADGTVALALAPGRSREIVVPVGDHSPMRGAERRLLLSFRLARDTAWAPKGHEVAWEQIDVGTGPPTRRGTTRTNPLSNMRTSPPDPSWLGMREEAGAVVVEGRDFTYRFDRTLGTLTSMRVDGRELLVAGPRPSLWRAPMWNETETDWGGAPIVTQWRAAGLDRLRQDVARADASRDGSSVRVMVDAAARADGTAASFENRLVYTVSPDGEIRIDHALRPSGPMPDWLPRVGLQLKVARDLRRFTWYGRGPFETYPDRKTGAKVGLYSGLVEEQYEPHLVPQDYGNKTDVRWAALTDGERGLLVAGTQLLNVSAQFHDTEALSRALFPPQLRSDAAVTLNLDHRVTGVGETPNKTHRKYRVLPGPYDYSVRIRPVRAGESLAGAGRALRF